MAGEYYDPDTGQVWYDDGQGNQWYVREANQWEQPGYQAPQAPVYYGTGPGSQQDFTPFQPSPYVVSSYPEQRADGSVWEVDQYSDGSFQSRQVQAATAAAPTYGGAGGYVGAPSGAPSGAAGLTASRPGVAGGVQPGLDIYQMLLNAIAPAEQAKLQQLLIPQMQAQQEQFRAELAFRQAQQAFAQEQQVGQRAQAEAGLTGFLGGQPTLARQQYAAQLQANPRDYAQYFAFTRPGEQVPVPAFAQQLAGGGQLGQPYGGGIGQAGSQNFGLQPGQFTPRNVSRLLPSERQAAESLINAQGENPEDFFARAKQFFPMGRLPANPRYTVF